MCDLNNIAEDNVLTIAKPTSYNLTQTRELIWPRRIHAQKNDFPRVHQQPCRCHRHTCISRIMTHSKKMRRQAAEDHDVNFDRHFGGYDGKMLHTFTIWPIFCGSRARGRPVSLQPACARASCWFTYVIVRYCSTTYVIVRYCSTTYVIVRYCSTTW